MRGGRLISANNAVVTGTEEQPLLLKGGGRTPLHPGGFLRITKETNKRQEESFYTSICQMTGHLIPLV
ncbi:hypothetical protein AV530_000623 [Patagioenas fasciata monilis]|uniref:Uncharacterized protein n=1 Tax=Patagioenas fasciata monilis TaxID=372326 RepID=A0A1V4IG23_PATFA|nr:hypothetical protein AV530_000623 [Patagioenas fasciata monilis]